MITSEPMLEYLENVAQWLIDNPDEDESQELSDRRDEIFRELNRDEQDHLNGLVMRIFGQWL